MTYGYTAHDPAGNTIAREGLTWRQLAVQNGNLIVGGYRVSAWNETTGEAVTDIPPSWAVKD